MASAPAQRFGRYRVVRPIGGGAGGGGAGGGGHTGGGGQAGGGGASGGGGRALLGYDELLGREVVIRPLPMIPLPPHAVSQWRAKFTSDARDLAALVHPAIVRVLDMGFEADVPYLVTEVIRGPSLDERLAREPMTPGEVQALGVQIARALEAAHGRGVLHRDVRPANIVEAEPGVWKLRDFGLASRSSGDGVSAADRVEGDALAYAPPEHRERRGRDERAGRGERGPWTAAADVYGVGAILAEALARGRDARPAVGVSESAATEEPRRALAARPAGGSAETRAGRDRLADVLARAVSHEPTLRPSAGELAAALAAAEAVTARPARLSPEVEPVRGQRSVLLATAAVVAALLLGIGVGLGASGGRVARPGSPGGLGPGANGSPGGLGSGAHGSPGGLGSGAHGSPEAFAPALRAPADDSAGAAPKTARSGAHEQAWRAAQEELARGQVDAAAERLRWIVERFEDPEARAELERVRSPGVRRSE